MTWWLSLVLWASCLAAVACAAPTDSSSETSFNNSTASLGSALVKKSFVWSALGDSWASGVSYDLLGRTDYDNNKDNCMRLNHAYAVQLSKDNTWAPNGLEQDLHFQACYGTFFEQIDRMPNHGHVQLDQIPSDIDMLLLQVGANNANLVATVRSCIFAPEGEDLGPAFPDPSGACAINLAKARDYVYGMEDGLGVNYLVQDTLWTVNAIFNHSKVKDNANFRLFVPGYFQPFYEGDGAGDWCNNASFALRSSDRPMLSLALRKEINGLIRKLNDGIKAGIAGSLDADRAHFIDVDSHVEGHRFCQPGHSLYDQYFGDKVYLWNFSPEGVVLGSGASRGLDNGNGAYNIREPTPEEFEHWRKTGFFTNDPSEVQTNMTIVAQVGLAKLPGGTVGNDTEWLNEIGPSANNFPALALRPFHPKEKGHNAMAQAISKAIKDSYGSTPSTGELEPAGQWHRSIQILFREFAGHFTWYLFVGPFGQAVDPCRYEGFQMLVANFPETRPNLALMYPPFVGYGTRWNLNFPNQWDCRFEAGQNDPGSLKCGNYLDYPFYKDARFDSGHVIACKARSRNQGTFKRAWTLELNI